MYSNQQLAVPLEHFDYKKFDPEIFIALLEISGTFMYILVEFYCFRHKKCTSECRIFNSKSNFQDFFTCHHAKYTALSVPLTRTLSLPYTWHTDKRSAFETRQGLNYHQ